MMTGRVGALPVWIGDTPEPTARPRTSLPGGGGARTRPHSNDEMVALRDSIGCSKTFTPSEAYRRVCIALLETRGKAPTRDVADLAGCSETFVRKVINDVMNLDT